MIIDSIDIKNIGTIKNWHFVFEPAVYMVYGRNGAGKSTGFAHALDWALFGKPWEDIKAEDIVTDEAAGGSVSVRSSLGTFVRSKTKAGLNLTLDGSEISQAHLESLIKIDRDLLHNSVIFGKGMDGFLLLPDKDKKELIAKINLQFIDQYIDKVNEVKAADQQALMDDHATSETLAKEIAMLSDSYYELKELFDTEHLKQGELQKEINEHKRSLRGLNAKYQTAQKMFDEAQDTFNQKSKIREAQLVDVRQLENEYSVLEQNEKHLQDSLSILDESECPVCFATISTDKSAVKRIQEHLLPQLENTKKLASACWNTGQIKTAAIELLEASLGQLSKTLNHWQQRIRELNQEVFICEQQIKQINDVSQQSTAENLQATLSEKEQKINELSTQAHKIEAKVKIFNLRIDAHNFWLLKLKEFRSQLFQKILNYFSPVCNSYLMHLTEGMFKIDLGSTLKGKKKISDKFEINVYQNGQKINFGRLSRGQQSIISLAMNMSFAQLMNKFYAEDWNVLIFDEVFDALDPVIRGRVVDMLITLKNTTKKSVVVITHNSYEPRQGIIPVEVYTQDGSTQYKLDN